MSTNTAAAYWSNHAGYAMNWYQFCAPYINERITGDRGLSPTLWALTLMPKPQYMLEIGCLDGKRLANLLKKKKVDRAAGLDVAAEAIARGRELYPDVELVVGDLNEPSLPEKTYDFILANGVLHHIDNIDVCIEALHASLQPGGWLMASEFTGPRRYVYSDAEIALVRQGQEILPPELRGKPFHPDQLKSKLDGDPSESVSTTVLEPTLRKHFAQVTAKPFGGNVLMRALTKSFFANFDAGNPVHVEAVDRLHRLDYESSQSNSHHTYFVCRRAS
jgi:SAM-dependent methyltransferase